MMKKTVKPMGNNSPKATYPQEINVPAIEAKEAKAKAEALSILAQHLSAENLAVLAKKATKKGINEKIQQFKHFI